VSKDEVLKEVSEMDIQVKRLRGGQMDKIWKELRRRRKR